MTATERPDAPGPASEQHDEDTAPRTPDVPWYDNWIVVLSTAVVLAVGLLYMIGARSRQMSAAAAGDAVRGGA